MEFYAAAAGLLPVLVLAVVVLIPRDPKWYAVFARWQLWGIVAMILTFWAEAITGEAASLNALLHGHATEWNRGLAIASLVTATTFLVYGTLLPAATALNRQWTLLRVLVAFETLGSLAAFLA